LYIYMCIYRVYKYRFMQKYLHIIIQTKMFFQAHNWFRYVKELVSDK
jgi:hypothetical protein